MQTMTYWPIEPNKRLPWNKGKLIGPKPPLQPRHVWAIRARFGLYRKTPFSPHVHNAVTLGLL
jgi:hypothetical protein